jgi:hypothetical protein
VANKIATPGKRAGTAVPRPEVPVAKAPVVQQPRTEPNRAPQQDERVAAQPPERHEPVKVVLMLSLATLRGAEDDVQKLHIPPDTELVEVQLDLEGLEEYKSFHAAVRSLEKEHENVTVWEKGGLALQPLEWGTALVLEIPASRLTVGSYRVVVTAGSEELPQDFEVVGENQ